MIKINNTYDILKRFIEIPIRLLKFKNNYQVITTGKHANKFLGDNCEEAIDLPTKYIEEIDFRQKTILFVREPRERLISGLAQEWYDVIWPTILYANLKENEEVISKSFKHYIAESLFDTVCRYDATHVAPWLHMAVEIKLKGKDSVSVIDFKNITKLFSMLNIKDTKDRDVSYINHKDLSLKFPNTLNKRLDYYLRFEYRYYKYLTEESNNANS